MMILKIISLNLGPLVCALLLFDLKNPLVVLTTLLGMLKILLVVFMDWVLVFLFR